MKLPKIRIRKPRLLGKEVATSVVNATKKLVTGKTGRRKNAGATIRAKYAKIKKADEESKAIVRMYPKSNMSSTERFIRRIGIPGVQRTTIVVGGPVPVNATKKKNTLAKFGLQSWKTPKAKKV